jgi:hypothetical protein
MKNNSKIYDWFTGLWNRLLGRQKDAENLGRLFREIESKEHPDSSIKELKMNIDENLEKYERLFESDTEFFKEVTNYEERENEKRARNEEIKKRKKWDKEISYLERTDGGENGRDNADRQELFLKPRHPHRIHGTEAEDKLGIWSYAEGWKFIKDKDENKFSEVVYRMQFIEWCTYLYNDYQVYLVIETCLLKTMIMYLWSVAQIILLQNIREYAKYRDPIWIINRETGETIDFRTAEDRTFEDWILISAAKKYEIFNGYNKNYKPEEIQSILWDLKITRDEVHINGIKVVKDIRTNNHELVKKVNDFIGVIETLRANSMREASKFKRDSQILNLN